MSRDRLMTIITQREAGTLTDRETWKKLKWLHKGITQEQQVRAKNMASSFVPL